MLKDCTFINIEAFSQKYFGGKSQAKMAEAQVWLRECSEKLNANDLTLPIGELRHDKEPIFYTDPNGNWWVGRYIGTLSFRDKTVDIEPRFPMEFIAQQLPLNKFALVNLQGQSIAGKALMHYLQALMWVNLFNRAAKYSLPLMKLQNIHEGTTIKGRLDIRRTLKSRTSKRDNAVSTYETKTLDNPLCIIIGLAFIEMQRWFPKQNLLHWLPPTIALRLQQIIAVAPRTKKVPNRKEINAIRYNSITASYKPLLKLSLDILSNRGVSFNSDNSQQTKGLLLDVAEIWELYTKKVLELAFSPYFSVVDGNRREGDYLLKANSKEKYLGKLKPDFWVEKTNGQKILVADAKYKKLGDLPWQSPKRDDLYQMTAYLDRYSSDFKGTTQGVLLYPKWPDENSDKVFCEIERESPWLLHSGAELSFMKISTDVLIAVEDLKQLGIIAKMQSA